MKHYAFYFFQGGVCGSRKTRWIRCNVPGRFYKTQMDLWLNAMCWPKNGGRKTFSCTSLRLLNHFTLPNHDFYGKVISTVLCCCHSNKIALAERLHSVISQDFPKVGLNFFGELFYFGFTGSEMLLKVVLISVQFYLAYRPMQMVILIKRWLTTLHFVTAL